MYRNTTIARTVLSNQKYLPPCYCQPWTQQYADCYPHPLSQLKPSRPELVFYESDATCATHTAGKKVKVDRASIAYR